jgi:hypothetical protein
MEKQTTKHNKYYYQEGRNGWTPTSTYSITKTNDMINPKMKMSKEELGLISKDRKEKPVYTGVLKYFPDAILEVARCSKVGNDQHNPDKDLFWDRSKSGDELDALSRHLLEAGTMDSDGIRHSTKVAWRSLANLQKEIELNGEAPLSKYNK